MNNLLFYLNFIFSNKNLIFPIFVSSFQLLFPFKAFSSFSILLPFCCIQAQTLVIKQKAKFTTTIKRALKKVMIWQLRVLAPLLKVV